MSDGRITVRERNGVAILDAAIDVLNADPSASMGDIAAAAGVGRATLYRHYPAREHLLAGIDAQVRAAVDELLAELEAAPHELERFVDGLRRVREGYACLAPLRATRDEARVREFWSPMLRVVAHLQADGTVDPALPPEWVVASFRGLVRAALAELDAGRLDPDAVPALVVRAFLRGVSP